MTDHVCENGWEMPVIAGGLYLMGVEVLDDDTAKMLLYSDGSAMRGGEPIPSYRPETKIEYEFNEDRNWYEVEVDKFVTVCGECL